MTENARLPLRVIENRDLEEKELTEGSIDETIAWLRTLAVHCCAKTHEDGRNKISNQNCRIRSTNLVCGHLNNQPVPERPLLSDGLGRAIELADRAGLLRNIAWNSSGKDNYNYRTRFVREYDRLHIEMGQCIAELKSIDDLAIAGYCFFKPDPENYIAQTYMRDFQTSVLPQLGTAPSVDTLIIWIQGQERVLGERMKRIRDRLIEVLESQRKSRFMFFRPLLRFFEALSRKLLNGIAGERSVPLRSNPNTYDFH